MESFRHLLKMLDVYWDKSVFNQIDVQQISENANSFFDWMITTDMGMYCWASCSMINNASSSGGGEGGSGSGGVGGAQWLKAPYHLEMTTIPL